VAGGVPEDDGVRGTDRIQILTCRVAAISQAVLIVAPTEDPLVRRHLSGALRYQAPNVFNAAGSFYAEVQPAQIQAKGEDVTVRVVEAGDDGLPAQVDDPRTAS